MTRNKTKTSAFGTNGRVNHNSDDFYALKLYDKQKKQAGSADPIENSVPESILDTVIYHDARSMSELEDRSVHLMVTSPPYNVGKEYDANLSEDDYKALLSDILTETYRVLVSGGRACVNVANFGRKPYLPAHAWVIELALQAGFQMLGEIIWDKAEHAAPSTAWGSWQSASSPILRDSHEYILVFYKESHSRIKTADKHDDIGRDDFLSATQSVWVMPPESATRVDHPAPFPEALPYRLIKLFSFKDEVVLDPFMGSGTTAVAAINAHRRYIGFEVDPKYKSAIEARIGQAVAAVSSVSNLNVHPTTIHDVPQLRTSKAVKVIVGNSYNNIIGDAPLTDDLLEQYLNTVFDDSISRFMLYPTWACTQCAIAREGTSGPGFRPERCPVCQSQAVYEIGSFQSRSSLIGKIFDEAVAQLLTRAWALKIEREPASSRTHRLRIGQTALATRGSPIRIIFPNGQQHPIHSAGMLRSDTRKKVQSTAANFIDDHLDMRFVVMTNAITDVDKLNLRRDLHVYDVTKVTDLQEFVHFLRGN